MIDLIITIFITVLPVAAIIIVMFAGIYYVLFYGISARFRFRARRMQELSKEFNLSFQFNLPKKYLKYFFGKPFRNKPFIFLKGVVNGHNIEISDHLYAWLSLDLKYRYTFICVDNKEVKGHSSLHMYLTPITRIRKILRNLE